MRSVFDEGETCREWLAVMMSGHAAKSEDAHETVQSATPKGARHRWRPEPGQGLLRHVQRRARRLVLAYGIGLVG